MELGFDQNTVNGGGAFTSCPVPNNYTETSINYKLLFDL